MRLSALAALALVAAAPASAATVNATLMTSTRAPAAGDHWRYSLTVRVDGRPAPALLRLELVVAGEPVGCWKRVRLVRCSRGRPSDWISVRGRRRASLRWPGWLAGTRLTFRATVRAESTTLTLDAPVVVGSRR